jgi:hypothetical protein
LSPALAVIAVSALEMAMTGRRSLDIALGLSIASLTLTLGVWVWIWTRPAGTFNDQGGLAITLIYFPLALVGWAACALSAIVVSHLAKKRASETDAAGMKRLRFITWCLIGLGLLLSLTTLFIA